MKSLICALGLVGMVSVAGLAHAATASWVGNPEPDVEAYRIYACFTAGCVVQKTPESLQGTAPHVGAGLAHTFVIELTGKEGAMAITARDFAQNESGLSVSVPFVDKQAPSIPAKPTLR